MSSLFSIFNISTRGLSTQQKAIGVTSHNIANANTEGYSRQRAVIETTRPFDMPSMNSYIGPGQEGTGATVKIINRIRDEFLDYQVRNENSTLGKYEARNKFLSEIENIFNEPSDSGLSTLVGKFFDAWQQLSKQPQTSNARTVVANQSAALADELNHTYNQFKKLKGNTQMQIKQTVFETNNILNQLDQLNQQIIGVKVAGQEPNDLMDRRDLLLDKLSKVMNINISKREFYSVDVNPEEVDGVPSSGEKLLIRKEPNYAISRFSYISAISTTNDYKTITIEYLKNGNSDDPGNKITLDISSISNEDERKEIFKQIDETRVLWSREDGTAYTDGLEVEISSKEQLKEKLGLFVPARGEFKGYMSVQNDVDKYVSQLNKLAKAIAFAVNAVHSGIVDAKNPGGHTNPVQPPDTDYMPFFVNKDIAKYDVNSGSISNLGSVLSGESEITAGNISVNEEILKDVMKIKTRTNDDKFAYEADNNIDGETDGNRALAIAQLRDKLYGIQNVTDTMDRKTFIENLTGNVRPASLVDDGTGVKTIKSNINGMKIDSYFKDIIDELGVQEQEAKRIVKNQNDLLAGFQESKESISGVSLDEEMANMIQYQHAYQANAKIVSVVDQLLDVVINGLVR
ncbi:flagellar hook-associated protein 1 [Clostridium tepidiprofundi DSM 19306]|uniref:Flagellar hook-associated protein 1 n=1 Tax=Clostridium tepidiprofundi DSM 19306 TaxID=1121338 RepID=A0A151B4H9_9CLOT|nr:flagellar hook-associated protein FlgK [Clostridium tepidiprofundi]KYH34796.1 flagellar hook-associated protein 1 [Clostridium tepidiprofundi DSM 19306]